MWGKLSVKQPRIAFLVSREYGVVVVLTVQIAQGVKGNFVKSEPGMVVAKINKPWYYGFARYINGRLTRRSISSGSVFC